MTEDSEYVLGIMNDFLVANGEASFVRVRRRKGGEPIRLLILEVEARGGTAGRRPQRYVLKDLTDEPITLDLPSALVERLRFHDRGVSCSIGEVRIVVEDVVPNSQRRFEPIVLSPTYDDYLNGTWVYRWDRWWNLDQYTHAKDDLLGAIRFILLRPEDYIPWCRPRGNWGGRTLAKVLAWSPVLAFIFWLAVIIRVAEVGANGGLICRSPWVKRLAAKVGPRMPRVYSPLGPSMTRKRRRELDLRSS